ncbi:unnamed protein product [Caenorhabditis auriculariae]|uniref:Uncharacterized protein n=1 Tax=Caenorhabditis auriculariae TaxID=2777116 RepID=A0A8S1GPX6_9PELO|nr:unnamed protein product [Caenorhabditis auriculariae]
MDFPPFDLLCFVKEMSGPKTDVRTAVPKTPLVPEATPLAEQSTFDRIKEIVWFLIMLLISAFVYIANLLVAAFEAISEVITKIYRICLFIYRKPHHSKELFMTTIHFLRVSYDADLWTWSEVWDVLKRQLIQPMSKEPPKAKDTTTTKKQKTQ